MDLNPIGLCIPSPVSIFQVQNEPKCIAFYKTSEQVVEVLVSGIVTARSFDGSGTDSINTWKKNELIFFC